MENKKSADIKTSDINANDKSTISDLIKQICTNDQQKGNFFKELIDQLITNRITPSRNKNIVQGVTEYCEYIKANRSEKYLQSVNQTFTHFMGYFSPAIYLCDLTIREIEKFLFRLKERAPKGYYIYYRNLRAAFSKFVDWGYIQENPLKKIKLPKRQKNKPAYITEADLERVLAAIPKLSRSDKNLKTVELINDFIKIAFYTGLRIGEQIELRCGNIDLKNGKIIVGDKNFNTKGRKQRFIPILKKIEEILIKRIKCKSKDDYLFGNERNKLLTKDYISKTLKRACRAAGIDEGIHYHSLRHSFASLLAEKGVSPFHLKELLGHSSVSITEIYSHVSFESLKEAVERL